MYYAACYRGIKSVDPTAKVGGPRHGQWQHPVPDPDKYKYIAAFSFRDWLEEFKKYLDENPDVSADFFSWQDYHYHFEGPNLSDGADAVRGYLRELGFSNDNDIPLLLCGGMGWGTWSDNDRIWSDNNDIIGEKPKYGMASYTARSIIREFKGGTKDRRFGRADYFFFQQNASLEHSYYSALVWIDDSTNPISLEYTAIYATFEMMKRLMQEDIPGAQIVQVKGNEIIEAMATFASNPVVIINNYSDQERDVDIKINLPADYGKTQGWTKLKACVQRIDEHHSNDGKGLEPEDNCWWPQPIAIENDPSNKRKFIQLSLNDDNAIAAWGTALIRFNP